MIPSFKYGSTQEKIRDFTEMLFELYDHIGDDGSLDPKIEDPLDMKHGHAEKHMESFNGRTLITRLINEGVSGAGEFINKRVGYESIIDAAIYNAEKIINWPDRDKELFPDKEKYSKLELTVKLGMDVIGYNLVKENKLIHESLCNGVHLVISRNPEASCGLTLTTAFAANEIAKGRQWSMDDILLNNMYDFRSNTEKAAFICSGMEKNIGVSYFVNRNKNERLRVWAHTKEGKYIAYIGNSNICRENVDVNVSKQIGNTRSICELSDLAKGCPGVISLIDIAKDIIVRGDRAIQDYMKSIERSGTKSIDEIATNKKTNNGIQKAQEEKQKEDNNFVR